MALLLFLLFVAIAFTLAILSALYRRDVLDEVVKVAQGAWNGLRAVAWVFWVRGGELGRAGWRPALGWSGVVVGLWAFVIAPQAGVTVDYPNTLIFLGMVTGLGVVRGAEKAHAAFLDRTGARGPGAEAGIA